jgi:hypothetical protein
MTTTPVSNSGGQEWPHFKFATALLCVMAFCATPAIAVEFGDPAGDFSGSWDTTMSYGSVWRTQGQSSSIICTSNGGNSRSCNYDDGTLNYDTGQVSNVLKVLTEVQMNYKNFGFFGRVSGFYDTKADDTQRTDLSSGTKDKVEKRFDWLDSFVYANFDVGQMPATVRVGKQVVSWGEGTFFPSGLGSLNTFDITKLRGAAVNLKEGLLPVHQVYANISPTDNLTVEAFYQYRWSDTEPDPVGSWFSTNDFAVDGTGRPDPLMLGFGAYSDQGTDWTPLGGFFDPSFQHVPRTGVGTPDDDGQYGLAIRNFFPDLLGGTEFGLYYANYHSRLPVLSGITGTQTGLGNAAGAATGAGATAAALASGLSFDAAVAQGTIAGVGAAAGLGGDISAEEINSWATVGGNTFLGGGDVGALAGALVTDQFGKTAQFYASFPEDIEIYGATFSTDIFGIAWQGEYTYKKDTPLQLDDVELLFAALSPTGALSPAAAGLGAFGQLGLYDVGETIKGYEEKDVSQFQTTFTYLSDPILGANVGALVWEGAATYVHDMDSKSSGGPNGWGLRYDAPGTFVSGNANLAGAHFNEYEGAGNFPDDFSWGYRMLARLTYNGLVGSWNVSPSIGFRQDVNGVTPGPGGNFFEGRTTTTLGINASLQNKWTMDLAWTSFNGGGHHNLVRDRDFLAFSLSLAF